MRGSQFDSTDGDGGLLLMLPVIFAYVFFESSVEDWRYRPGKSIFSFLLGAGTLFLGSLMLPHEYQEEAFIASWFVLFQIAKHKHASKLRKY